MPTSVDTESIFNTVLPSVYIKKVRLLPSAVPGSKSGKHVDAGALDGFQTNYFGKKTLAPTSIDFSNLPRDSKGLVVEVELLLKDKYRSSQGSHWFQDNKYLDFLNLRVVLCTNKNMSDELAKGQFTPKFLKRTRSQNKFLEQTISLKKNVKSLLSEQRRTRTGNENTYDISYTVSFALPNYNPRHLTVFAHTFMDLHEVLLSKGSMGSPKKGFFLGTAATERVLERGAVKNNAYIYILPNGKLWAGPMHYRKNQGYMAGAFHTRNPHPPLERKRVSNFFVEDYRLLEEMSHRRLLLRPFKVKRKKPGYIKNAHDIKIIKSEAYISEPIYSSNANNRVKFLFNFDYERLVKESTQYGAILQTTDSKAKNEIFSKSRIKNLRVFRHRVEQGLAKNDLRRVEYDDRTELIGHTSEETVGNLKRHTIERTVQPDDVEAEKVVVGAIKEINLSINAGSGIRTIGITDYDMSTKTDGLYSYSVEMEIEDGTVAFVRSQLLKLSQTRKALTEYYNEASRKENSDPITGRFKDKFIRRKKNEYSLPSQKNILSNNRSVRSDYVQSSVASSPWLNSISAYMDVLFNLTSVKYGKLVRFSKLLHQMCDPSTGSTIGLETTINLIRILESQIKSEVGTTIRSMDEMDFETRTAAFKGKLSKNTFTVAKDFKTVHDSNVPKNLGYDFLAGSSRKSIGPRLLTTEQYGTRMDAENRKYFNTSYEGMSEVSVTDGTTDSVDFTRDMNLRNGYYSYLSPATINVGKKRKLRTIRRGAGMWSSPQYNALFSSILALNSSRNSPMKTVGTKTSPRESSYDIMPPVKYTKGYNADKMSISEETYSININNSIILGSINVMFSSVQDYENKMLSKDLRDGLEPVEASFVDPINILGESTNFTKDPLGAEELAISEDATPTGLVEEVDLSALSNLFVSSLINSGRGLFVTTPEVSNIEDILSTNVDNFIDKHFDNLDDGSNKKKQFIDNLPNQIKSIFLGAKGQARKNWFAVKANDGLDLISAPELYALFYCLYQHLNIIEVLVGYKKSGSGKSQISRPIWETMTKEKYDRIKNNNFTVLCRMVPYQNSILGFRKSPKCKMPEFDSTFLLGPRLTADAPETSSVMIVDNSTNPPETSDLVQEVYIERLTEYSPLSTTGTNILKELVRNLVLQDDIPSEFSSTAFIQQPRTLTRVGTRFSSEAKSSKVSPTGTTSMLNDLRSRRRRGPTGGGTGGMSGGGY